MKPGNTNIYFLFFIFFVWQKTCYSHYKFLRNSDGDAPATFRKNASFNMMDANLFNGDAKTKELKTIISGIDSLNHVSDSIGHHYRQAVRHQYLKGLFPMAVKDSADLVARALAQEPLDSTYHHLTTDRRKTVIRSALSNAQSTKAEFEFRGMTTENLSVFNDSKYQIFFAEYAV